MVYSKLNPHTGTAYSCDADFLIYGFPNSIFGSSTWLIINAQNLNVFIIDPGSSTQPALIPFIVSQNLKPHSVFLTHEHFDHCLGVNPLAEHFSFKLIATKSCVENIAIPGRNHSLYYEGCEAFSINHPDTQIIVEETKLNLSGIQFLLVPTPGHTPGGMCILTEHAAFTGDTILNNTPTPLKFHNSNKDHYRQSIDRLRALFSDGMTIFPGHGEPFIYKTGMI